MSDKRPSRVMDYILSVPWAITSEWLGVIYGVADRAAKLDPKAIESEFGRPLENTRRVTIRNGVATVPLSGPLFRYANLFTQISGASSLEVFATDFSAALKDQQVGAILLAVDSPGGEVNGTAEVAELIYRARSARGGKPLVAHISGTGASAAYWIASAVDEIVVSETALVGSIGTVVRLYKDPKNADAIEIVSSQAPKKPMDPETKAGRESIQQVLDDLADVFINTVARNRGVSREDVLSDFGQGDVLVGRKAALAGMADRVGTFEETHERLAATVRDQSPSLFVGADVPAEPRWAGSSLATVLAGGSRTVPALTFAIHGESRFMEGVEAIMAQLRRLEASHITAPKAAHEEDRMSEVKIAAPQGPDVLSVEKERIGTILRLCRDNDVPLAKAQEYVEGGKTVAQVQDEIIKRYRESGDADPIHVPGSESVRITRDAAEAPFASAGEQLQAIAQATKAGFHNVDKRLLQINAAAGMSEGVPADGGFLLQPTFVAGVREKIYSTGSILSRVTTTPIGAGSNSIVRRMVDETSRVDGSRFGGLQAFWVAEAGAGTRKKPKYRQHRQTLEKIIALLPTTEELLEDAVALQADMNRIVPQELRFVAEDAVINGTGAGMPLGLLNAAALVSVAKETSQAADSVVKENIFKMYARAYAANRANMVWLINQDVEPQLFGLALGDQGIYFPAGTFANQPLATLFGRPVIPVEYAATLGDQGDIMFVDLAEYEIIEKGGIRTQFSMHVLFDTDEQEFKFTWRINGQPFWNSALTPFKGTNTLSPYITLDARA